MAGPPERLVTVVECQCQVCHCKETSEQAICPKCKRGIHKGKLRA